MFLPVQGGMWVFNLMDYQVAGLSLLVLVFCEVITVSWLYGECLAISLSVLLFICLLTYSFIHFIFFHFCLHVCLLIQTAAYFEKLT